MFRLLIEGPDFLFERKLSTSEVGSIIGKVLESLAIQQDPLEGSTSPRKVQADRILSSATVKARKLEILEAARWKICSQCNDKRGQRAFDKGEQICNRCKQNSKSTKKAGPVNHLVLSEGPLHSFFLAIKLNTVRGGKTNSFSSQHAANLNKIHIDESVKLLNTLAKAKLVDRLSDHLWKVTSLGLAIGTTPLVSV